MGFTIRLAVPADALDIARLNVRVWQIAYRGQMPDSFLDALEPVKRVPSWSNAVVDPRQIVLVAEGDRSIVGFCSLLPSRDADARPDTGELAAIYVEPACWRSGVGRSLIENALTAARVRGFAELSLWVLVGNLSARQFYEKRGFETDGNSKLEQRPGFSLHEIRCRRAVA